jgi:hypothetical protein
MGKRVGMHCVRGDMRDDACRVCATDPLHPCELPANVLESLRQGRDVTDLEFTPTSLMDCPRKRVLKARTDWYLDIGQAWPALRGTLMHARLELLPPTPGVLSEIKEVRLQTTVNTHYGPQTVKGRSDLIVVQDISFSESEVLIQVQHQAAEHMVIKVVDYKSRGEVGHDMTRPARNHQRQVNIYGWLAARALPEALGRPNLTVEVAELEIFYAGMNRPRRFTSAGPLQTRGKRVSVRPLVYETLTLEPIVLYPPEVIERWVVHRVEQMIEAEEYLPPVLTGEDADICRFCPVRVLCQQLAEGVV